MLAAAVPLETAKQDEQGRRIADAAEKQALIGAYEASGMTQRAFARREGINYFVCDLAAEEAGGGSQVGEAASVYGNWATALERLCPGSGLAGWTGDPWDEQRRSRGPGQGAALMLSFPSAWKVYLAVEAVDTRFRTLQPWPYRFPDSLNVPAGKARRNGGSFDDRGVGWS